MKIRIALASLSLLLLAGCDGTNHGYTETDEGGYVPAKQPIVEQICPLYYDPVCGKDGTTYSNVCFAGGQQHVAYEGACNDSCDGVVCTHGQICEPGSECPPCAGDPDTGECHPCDPIPAHCVDRPKKGKGHQKDDPCALVKCASGYHCEAVQVQCIQAPCPPIAECVADPCAVEECGPALGMPNTLCPDGVTVAGPTGNCVRGTDGVCGWEVVGCP